MRRTGACVTDEQVRKGIASARINGRMEVVQEAPRVILDGAHNPAEARALAAALKRDMQVRSGKLHLVCGILRDKDQAAMVRALAPVADSVVATQPPLETRQGDLSVLAGLFGEHVGPRNVSVSEDPTAALDAALARARVVGYGRRNGIDVSCRGGAGALGAGGGDPADAVCGALAG